MIENNDETAQARRGTRTGVKIALVAAGLAAGVIGASAIGANAAQSPSAASTSTGSTASSAPAAPDSARGPAGGHGGAAPVRSDEKSLSDTQAAAVKKAALAEVPGGTVYRVETDAGDGEYEAHLTKADGSLVTVKLDKDFKVIKTESGMGTGDPAPSGGAPAQK